MELRLRISSVVVSLSMCDIALRSSAWSLTLGSKRPARKVYTTTKSGLCAGDGVRLPRTWPPYPPPPPPLTPPLLVTNPLSGPTGLYWPI